MRLLPSLLLLTACGTAAGGSCRLDSDCEGGLMCLEGVCATRDTALAAFAPKDATDGADGAAADTSTADTAAPDPGDTATDDETWTPIAGHTCGEQPYMHTYPTCEPDQGIFEAGATPCAEPSAKYAAKSIRMEAEGGFVKMAALANPILEKGVADGSITAQLWQDGALALNCAGQGIWVRDADDRGADCASVTGSDTFPLTIPLSDPPLYIVVRDITFDLQTGRLEGLVDRDKLIADLPEAIRETGANLVEANVDTDDDGKPDDSTVVLTVCF